jgi:hypothetical protein
MLTSRTLQRINNRPRKVNRLPLVAIGGGSVVLSALLYVLEVLPTLGLIGTLLAGALGTLGAYRSEQAKTTVSLSYKGNLNDEVSSRFSEVREALETLASSQKIWSLADAGKLPKAGEVTPSPEREPAQVGLLKTPGIRADVPIWGIEAAGESIFFFPEGVLHYKNDHYYPFSYKLFKANISSARFFEEEELPEDANVVENVWRFSRPDGSPDPRYRRDNVQIPVVLYTLLEINLPSELKVHLIVSSRQAAIHFAMIFGAKDPRKEERTGGAFDASSATSTASGQSSSKGREEAYHSAEALQREASLASARKLLGVAKGASAEQINAAYRKLARTHHPDKVANLEPEVRENSEQRMKEINAAYALLKRQRSDPTVEGVG